MPRYLNLDAARRLAIKAFQAGGTQKVTRDGLTYIHHIEWDIAGRCQRPVEVIQHGRPYRDRPRTPRPRLWITTMQTKCRECENCLKLRAAHWRLRALTEYKCAPRTWLITLTFSPDNQFKALSRARRHVDAQGVEFESLPTDEQFLLRHRETGREVTLFLKRLRKSAEFRYALVVEAHASGLPHYHLLLHEIGEPISHRKLTGQWTAGFSKANLVHEERGATYAMKYLTKSRLARVRASVNYGFPVQPTPLGLVFP